jgi:two-component system sporulation sensor kinase B
MSGKGSPFYSTKEKGTGLGMMVVFSVVQAMNGKIDIISFSFVE